MTTDHLTRSSSTTGSGTSSVRSTILAAGLALAAATDAVLLVVRPWGERDAPASTPTSAPFATACGPGWLWTGSASQ